jgi:drug/metabolite transporter (DMT)-like permease
LTSHYSFKAFVIFSKIIWKGFSVESEDSIIISIRGVNLVFAVAALLTLLSGVLSGVGHSLQRRSLDSLPELTPIAFFQKHIKLLFAIFTTPLWLLGGFLAVCGALLRWQAFSGADVILLKPLTNVNILVVVVICVWLWGEHIGHFEWIGIGSLLAGVVMLSYAAEERVVVTYDLAWYIISTILSLVFVILLISLGSRSKSSAKDKELFFALGAGILYGIATIFLKAMTVEVLQVLGFFQILNPLCIIILITRMSFWLYVVSSVVAYFLLQCAYSRRRASVALPVNNSLSTFVPIVIAVLVFGDVLFIPFDGLLIFPFSFLRIIGIIAVLAGIIMLRRFQTEFSPTQSPNGSLEKE